MTDNSQGLTLGSAVTGAITSQGQRQQYTFTLPAKARLYYDALTNISNLRWYLDGPAGNVVNNAAINSDNLLGTLIAGNYTLTIFANNNNDVTGSYQFRLFDLAEARQQEQRCPGFFWPVRSRGEHLARHRVPALVVLE